MSNSPTLSIVVIGRNEGARLIRCLRSVFAMRKPGGQVEIFYVDSASSDDSVNRARQERVTTIELAPDRPCAAIARNAGWRAASAEIIMFLDGDTELNRDFVAESIKKFDDPRIAVVYGNRREPEARGFFSRVLDLDWIHRPGYSDYCGGDALVRRSVLEELGGFDEKLIAGEEPELCWRIRSRGWIVLHVDRNMVKHDLGITRFSQYWQRAIRTGYAYAEVSRRFQLSGSPLWLRESRHNQINGSALLALLLGGPGLSVCLRSLFPLIVMIAILISLATRTALRNRWKGADATSLFLYGLHSHFQQIPILVGQMKYWLHRRRGIASQLIEYKGFHTVPGIKFSEARRR